MACHIDVDADIGSEEGNEEQLGVERDGVSPKYECRQRQ